MQEKTDNQQLILNELQNSSLPAIDTQTHRHLNVGDNLNAVLDFKKYFYFIMEGKLKISQVDFQSGKEQILQLLTRGDMLDLITLLDNKPHDFYGVALEKSELIEVPMENVRYLLDKDPAFKELFFPYMAAQLRSMENLVTELSFHDVYQRLINLFTRFVDTTKGKPSFRLINNLSHEDLAAMVGSVRKVVNRNLQKLKSEGIISMSRKRLGLESLKKLRDKLKF